MKNRINIFLLFSVFVLGCVREKVGIDFAKEMEKEPKITGKQSYLDSPYVTAGNRVYMVGHQNGTFPELGWHIQGEMGGVWDHPIKLMDGFKVELDLNNKVFHLDSAKSFVNYPMANKHEYRPSDENLVITRWQFVPDDKEGLIVQFDIENTSNNISESRFRFLGFSDLRPTWLGEKTNMVDGRDKAEFLKDRDAWMVKDKENPWFVLFGADERSTSQSEVVNSYSGLGSANALEYSLSIPAKGKKTLNFFIAGSYQSQEAALKTYNDIKTNSVKYLSEKKVRYSQLSKLSKLTVPDKDLEEAFEWLKYNCDWLIRTVPEIGTGISAGLPDYPWWFGVDSEYALKGYMAIGQTDAVYKTIQLLDSVSNTLNGNGKIIHEMSTNGAVFNNGNINETPQFASLIWDVFQWNGDKEFLRRYFPTVKKGLSWLMEENDKNKNLFPDGFGMMEIHGLNSEMIDVASYTQKAFADASKIANELGDQSLSSNYSDMARTIKNQINEAFWSEEFGSYADFIGTDEQALHLIEDALVRADTLNKPWAVTELKQTKQKILAAPSDKSKPFVLHHNWVVNTPMEMGIADSAKAIKGLETAENFVNPFGMFVTGIDRDASAGSDDGSFKGSKMFSYTGAVMTLPTGVQAIAENNYGRPDKALNYIKRMTRTFSYALPGSIYEVSPDYGMMTQAWNIYGYAIPIVQQFFGIRPDAVNKKVVVKPQMPSKWDSASLENVAVANNRISIFYKKKDGLFTMVIKQTEPDWTIEFILSQDAIPDPGSIKGNLRTITYEEHMGFRTEDMELQLQWKQ